VTTRTKLLLIAGAAVLLAVVLLLTRDWSVGAVLSLLASAFGWSLVKQQGPVPKPGAPDHEAPAEPDIPEPEPIPEHQVTDHEAGSSIDNPVGDFLDQHYGGGADG
jgi:hypothetical protein